MISNHHDAIAARESLGETVLVIDEQKDIRRLEYENEIMREALKDLAYGAVMMIEVTSGATRQYVREVYRVAMQAVGAP